MTDPTPTDWRALCAELVDELEEWVAFGDVGEIELAHALIDRVRAALAQPEPQGPTDKELGETYRAAYYACENRQGPAAQVFGLRAVLARWGRPAIEPVLFGEHLPGSGDYDAEWRCWVLRLRRVWDSYFTPTWALVANSEIRDTDYWLPHHALPVPQQEAE